jgi:electron transfer flavoprotein alpha/beta subunit
VTGVADKTAETTGIGPEAARNCLCESFARGTERAALASARWLGRADEAAAQEAAAS